MRFRDRLFNSYKDSGPGVILSSLDMAVGFSALRASEFEPFDNFGTMAAIAIAGSTVGNLVFLPACPTLAQPWMAEKRPADTTLPTGTKVVRTCVASALFEQTWMREIPLTRGGARLQRLTFISIVPMIIGVLPILNRKVGS